MYLERSNWTVAFMLASNATRMEMSSQRGEKWRKARLCSDSNLLQNLLCCSPSYILWRWEKCHHWWNILRTRTAGRLFNRARLRAKTKNSAQPNTSILCRRCCLRFTQETGLQSLINSYAAACVDFPLDISIKTCCNAPFDVHWHAPRRYHREGIRLKKVDSFCYLCSFVSNYCSLEKEIETRIEKAATTFNRIKSRAWRILHLTLRTKATPTTVFLAY